MTFINVKLTLQELELLASLASDQLFRREFIDPKMPGYKTKPGEILEAKALVARLRSLASEASAGGNTRGRGNGMASHRTSPAGKGTPNAV